MAEAKDSSVSEKGKSPSPISKPIPGWLTKQFRNDINTSRNSEFFIAMGKEDQHSFLMLGVRDNNTPPTARILASVAKRWDVEPVQTLGRALKGDGALARIANELTGDPTDEDDVSEITYEAYTITLKQLEEFLAFIKEVEKKQLENPKIKHAVDLLEGKHDTYKGICCFLPNKTGTTFKYGKLSEYTPPALLDEETQKKVIDIAAQGEHITAGNTCRTSALNIIELVLGFKTTISKYFNIAPKYSLTLLGGQPKAEMLYIVPPPPQKCEHYKKLPPKQQQALELMYQRLKQIPQKDPGNKITRDKFDCLKGIYNKVAGESKVKVMDLLEGVAKSREALFKSRGAVEKIREAFGIESVDMTMFKKIISELKEETSTNDQVDPFHKRMK
jgi:hypothetical protein